MQLRSHWFAAALLGAGSVGCANGFTLPMLANGDTPPTIPPGSTLSALPLIASASTDGQATELFVDPGTQYAMDASTAPSNNPNKTACEAALGQLTTDQRELRRTNEWEALRTSGPYLAVATGIKNVRHDGCHTAITATVRCQADMQQLNTAIAYLWRSAEYEALARTSEYAILQNDAHAIASIGPVWHRCADVHRQASLEASPNPSQYSVLAKYDAGRAPWQYQTQTAAARLVAPTVSAVAHGHAHLTAGKHVASRGHGHKHRHHGHGWGSRI